MLNLMLIFITVSNQKNMDGKREPNFKMDGNVVRGRGSARVGVQVDLPAFTTPPPPHQIHYNQKLYVSG